MMVVGSFGVIDIHDRLIKESSNSVSVGILFVNYSRSPEANTLQLWNKLMIH